MPSNGPAENILYGLKGIPLFTYGMIGITTLVLAYVTFTEVDIEDNPLNSINPISQLEEPIMNQIDQITNEPEDSIKEEQTQEEKAQDNQSQEDNQPQEEKDQSKEEELPQQDNQPQQDELPPQLKEEEQSKKQQELPKQGGKKRTIRNRNKKRKTIRK